MRHQAGFSLIEALCVLAITSLIICCLAYLPIQKLGQSYLEKSFKDQLASQLYQAQDKAIIDQAAVLVQFVKQGPVRFKQTKTRQVFAQVWPPQGWTLNSSASFYYLPDGRINQFQTINFQKTDGQLVSLVFQLGSGQFVFKEQ